MPELLGICDRICVMNDGAFVGEFAGADATQEKIMRAIMRNNKSFRRGMDESDMQTGGMRP
jgi:putative multiple sugar transport system ATP-binding protein